jgi:hypothetical protein
MKSPHFEKGTTKESTIPHKGVTFKAPSYPSLLAMPFGYNGSFYYPIRIATFPLPNFGHMLSKVIPAKWTFGWPPK